MKDPSPYFCDECGEKKKTTNHWYILLTGAATGFSLVRWGAGSVGPDDADVSKHLCSENCVSKALSKWFRAPVKETHPNRPDTLYPIARCEAIGPYGRCVDLAGHDGRHYVTTETIVQPERKCWE